MSQIEITQISPEEHDAFEAMFNKLCSEILARCHIHDGVALDWHALTKAYVAYRVHLETESDEGHKRPGCDDGKVSKAPRVKENNSNKKQRRETSVYRSSSAEI